jgi:hypothetical protein
LLGPKPLSPYWAKLKLGERASPLVSGQYDRAPLAGEVTEPEPKERAQG